MTQKNVLITGASRGIGKACAEKFAKEGYHVFINCHNSLTELSNFQEQLSSSGMACTIVPGDVGNPDQVRQIFSTISSTVGGIDVLINNAGIAHIGLLMDLSDENWDRILSTNLSSAFYCSRAAMPYMISQKKGKIINISSMWGRVGASCEVAYSAAKAGLNGFTMALAKELAPSNIQVNAIACGVIDTVMNCQLSEAERQCLMDEIPAGRFASPEEVAELAFDLAEKYPYMTGQILGFDGGYI